MQYGDQPWYFRFFFREQSVLQFGTAPRNTNDFNFSDDVLRRQREARRGILTQSGSGASKHAVMNRMSLGTVVTSRGVYRAARATDSRSRHPVGVRALTEL